LVVIKHYSRRRLDVRVVNIQVFACDGWLIFKPASDSQSTSMLMAFAVVPVAILQNDFRGADEVGIDM
jgi:hypothetical protein